MNKLILLFLFTIITSALGFSQEVAEIDNSKTKKVSKIFSYEAQVSDFLVQNQVNRDFLFNNNSSRNNNSLVVVQQIGIRNSVTSKTLADGTSSMQYIQTGNENVITSTNSFNNVTERIFQSGNNNRVNNFAFGNLDNVGLNIIQNGNNLTVEKFGVNSQTNNISLKLVGNNQSVIVRSF
ncbi:hypothetical protein [Winogradskyella jejuensis]|uniref:Curlin associated repeat-containing protein n=1 Tax=Winogradskyella jejuensis TaxID=1089305 RepID=A0A1M5S2C1_9FLAO|nr:hypothetical protein [Winogradskyella jejuensis]SHH32561.1 hypothetical protein SAMN05444148_1753 [Winogradskyella jejuensis]